MVSHYSLQLKPKRLSHAKTLDSLSLETAARFRPGFLVIFGQNLPRGTLRECADFTPYSSEKRWPD